MALALTPFGQLWIGRDDDAPHLPEALVRGVMAGLRQGPGPGLLALISIPPETPLAPSVAYWRELTARFLLAVGRAAPEDPDDQAVAPPLDDPAAFAAAAPPMTGGEYLSAAVIVDLWGQLAEAFAAAWRASCLPLDAYLAGLDPSRGPIGRVHFNLAENRSDDEAPFAFLATYTDHLGASGRAQHLPLGRALTQYAKAEDRKQLVALLGPVERAAAECPWLRALVEAGEIFHPLRWTAQDAYRMLSDAPRLEACGVMVRMPAIWRGARPSRPRVSVTVGGRAPTTLGAEALVDFDVQLTLDGDALTPAEIREILATTSGLALIRGRWIEVDRDRLASTLREFEAAKKLAARQGLSFFEGMRLLAGATLGRDKIAANTEREWVEISPGPWLAKTLAELRDPSEPAKLALGATLRATLRPYQQRGLQWLHTLSRLGLGGCLADDMGLGKTIQILALLLLEKHARSSAAHGASLLVVPASLLGNWAAEIDRFAPTLRYKIAHGSAAMAGKDKAADLVIGEVDLVITTYGAVLRQSKLAEHTWNLVIADEAQAIKNPGAKQTRALKELRARVRFALTGTPVENSLGDLWSIFDFANPGLLGSARDFSAYAKSLAKAESGYRPLRELIRPYLLRRLKTDRAVIADLPDKTEVVAYCSLSRKQATLYQQAVEELAELLRLADGIKRRGVVLAALVRLKQICNHPSQWLGDHGWAEADSGKWARVRELGEIIAAKQEKVLVFTQFREVIPALSGHLGEIFGRPGLELSGQTAVGKRRELVERFQSDPAVPFFVISLKAGGSGLNLTAASHVIHFDRWWNPAVENQATDRAFRIGQSRNVMVHKFVCRGTVEEKIHELIESKRALSQELLDGSAELNLTELDNDALLDLVRLDLHSATGS